MDVNPGCSSLAIVFLLLLALAGFTLMPASSSGPVGVGPQAPVAAEASVAP